MVFVIKTLPARPCALRANSKRVVHQLGLGMTNAGVLGGNCTMPRSGDFNFYAQEKLLAASAQDRSGAAAADFKPSIRPLLRGLMITALVIAVVCGFSKLAAIPQRYALIAFAVQWAFFLLHGWPQRSEKLYDASGSLTHFALVMAALTADSVRSPRQILLGLCAVVWCTRLGTFLFNRIAQDAKDDRFTDLKTRFWNFSIAWNLQVAWVFLLELPILIANSVAFQPRLGARDALGALMWTAGFLLESVADSQKFAFRGNASNKGRYITTGLWRYSRHPNYFGEILMWLGLCVLASPCFTGWRWLGWTSPLFNAFLLLYVSGVPMLEKSGESKWGSEKAYRHYMKNTSCIVPWFPAPSMTEV